MNITFERHYDILKMGLHIFIMIRWTQGGESLNRGYKFFITDETECLGGWQQIFYLDIMADLETVMDPFYLELAKTKMALVLAKETGKAVSITTPGKKVMFFDEYNSQFNPDSTILELFEESNIQFNPDSTILEFKTNSTPDSEALQFASRSLPGIEQPAKYPCGCHHSGVSGKVSEIIIHLNDRERWSREKIADWIDDLQDKHGYDFTFQLEEK